MITGKYIPPHEDEFKMIDPLDGALPATRESVAAYEEPTERRADHKGSKQYQEWQEVVQLSEKARDKRTTLRELSDMILKDQEIFQPISEEQPDFYQTFSEQSEEDYSEVDLDYFFGQISPSYARAQVFEEQFQTHRRRQIIQEAQEAPVLITQPTSKTRRPIQDPAYQGQTKPAHQTAQEADSVQQTLDKPKKRTTSGKASTKLPIRSVFPHSGTTRFNTSGN